MRKFREYKEQLRKKSVERLFYAYAEAHVFVRCEQMQKAIVEEVKRRIKNGGQR